MTELHEKLERVIDRESFFDFVSALLADRKEEEAKERENPSNPYGPGVNGWENTTIAAFLEAALAWAKATNMGETQGLPNEANWKGFALFLYCGKIYE
jgi:hypothetical protein